MPNPSRFEDFIGRALALNAPDDYRWTAPDVMDEKVDGFYAGMILGVILMAVIAVVLVMVLA